MLQKRVDETSISPSMMRQAEGVFHQYLKQLGLMKSGQRDTVLRTFLETRDHLSADDLHQLLRFKRLQISPTTVYRTLKLLADCGLATATVFQDGIVRYEHSSTVVIITT